MRSKDGDRFFFTHKNQPGSFTKSARNLLINRTFAGLICDNTDLTSVRGNVFLLKSDFIDCENKAPQLELDDISNLLEIGTD